MNDILTATEAAELLQIHITSAYRLAKAGKIPACKVGGDWRFSRMVLLRFVASGGKIENTLPEPFLDEWRKSLDQC